jgi:recombination protein RecR
MRPYQQLDLAERIDLRQCRTRGDGKPRIDKNEFRARTLGVQQSAGRHSSSIGRRLEDLKTMHNRFARYGRTPAPRGPSEGGGYAADMLSPAVENLVTQLSKLPGIGRRSAQRLAFHLLSARSEDALELAHAIEDVKTRVRFCRECGNLTEEELCEVCADARRDRSLICVVEQPVDVVSLERTHEFRGLYHVLGGALSPLDGVEPSDLRIDALVTRVERDGVEEVVLATNPNMTGEATAAYLADRLRGRTRVTRLASGLPVGGDLEYADEVTLGRALAGRREM